MLGHSGQVRSLSFEPESTEIFASGGEDGTLRLWSICDGRCLKVLISVHFIYLFLTNLIIAIESPKNVFRSLKMNPRIPLMRIHRLIFGFWLSRCFLEFLLPLLLKLFLYYRQIREDPLRVAENVFINFRIILPLSTLIIFLNSIFIIEMHFRQQAWKVQ